MDHLPKTLKNLVNKNVGLLGDVIKEEGGKSLYNIVENIRQDMVLYRRSSSKNKDELLESLFKKLKRCSPETQNKIAHSYTLMLELINACETSYRTFRLREKKAASNLERQGNALVYVLTAHPTEARTSENISLFQRITDINLNVLEKSGEEEYLMSLIKHNLKLAWLIPVTRHEKPQVVDEANHLFSIILREDIFDTLLRANRDLGRVSVRTWVGGDKDGHPGVDEKVMMQSLCASRNHFCKIINNILLKFESELKLLGNDSLESSLKNIKPLLKNIKTIKKQDLSQVRALKERLTSLDLDYIKIIGAQNPRLRKVLSIIDLFPGLVIPLELREDSEIIQQALISSKPLAIARMLSKLKEITGDGNVRCYAQGMIISMCESYKDVTNTMTLLKRNLGKVSMPVIPLFETDTALENSSEIVTKMISNKTYLSHIKKNWNNSLEIMLGYSDSSKGMGVFASRLGIARTMRSLDALITKNKIKPIFFHGSGGSVDRGGGSLNEQTAWWPKSALELYKATIQGEMVERSFSTPEVMLSGMDKIFNNFSRLKGKKGVIQIEKEVENFAFKIQERYVKKINDLNFFEMVELATPYSYLNVLKLGSRPAKRSKSKSLDFRSIRAIPWVLCWTQTRTLFPTWWGVGSAWKEYMDRPLEKNKLKSAYKKSFLFSSFIRTLGFTLSKVDLHIFKLYLSQSKLSTQKQKQVLDEFQKEYKLACQLVTYLSKDKDLLWFKPWLKDSINLRSSMIHPLNALQIIGNQTNDLSLVRKTVAGISSGMMTTG